MTTKDPTKAAIGQEIRRRRAEMGWSQADLAAYADVAANTVGQAENGDTMPRAVSIAKIAKALGCTMADLEGART